MNKIIKVYADCDSKPTIEATDNAFKIVLPNMHKNTNISPLTGANSEVERMVFVVLKRFYNTHG